MNSSAVSNRAAGATQAAVPLRKKIAKVAVNVAAVAALTAAPAAMAYDVELGTEVFEGNCATCHTGGKNVLIPYKTLQKDAIEQYLEGGFNLTAITNQFLSPNSGVGKERLRVQIINGKGQMPAWKTVLEPEEIEAVANYVYATSAADGW